MSSEFLYDCIKSNAKKYNKDVRQLIIDKTYNTMCNMKGGICWDMSDVINISDKYNKLIYKYGYGRNSLSSY